MKILHLTLKKEWFDLIKSGQKKFEYRLFKLYWLKRFVESDVNGSRAKIFDYIHFKNGYGKNAPSIYVEWKGLDVSQKNNPFKKPCFRIGLGDVVQFPLKEETKELKP